MGVVSSKTLFHFTSKFENLDGILKNGFIPRYCLENLTFGGKKFEGFAIPMVSFCDIPLTNIRDHIKKYGRYALGMSNEWAREKGLNPVLYLRNSSLLTNHIFNHYTNMFNGHIDDEEEDDFLLPLREIAGFIKPYEGIFSRKLDDYYNENEIFYNEREWRFVPRRSDSKKLPLLSKEEFEALKSKDANSTPILFDHTDIKYIIVANDSDIEKTIKTLKDANFSRRGNDLEKLYSLILTMEQILDDF